MAITITHVLQGTDTYICTAAVSAAELSVTIPHGLGFIPKEVEIAPAVAVVASSPSWAATTINATNVVITRDTTGASTADTVRVTAKRPHSIGS